MGPEGIRPQYFSLHTSVIEVIEVIRVRGVIGVIAFLHVVLEQMLSMLSQCYHPCDSMFSIDNIGISANAITPITVPVARARKNSTPRAKGDA